MKPFAAKGAVRNYHKGGMQIIWGGSQFFELSKREGQQFLNFSEGESHSFLAIT